MSVGRELVYWGSFFFSSGFGFDSGFGLGAGLCTGCVGSVFDAGRLSGVGCSALSAGRGVVSGLITGRSCGCFTAGAGRSCGAGRGWSRAGLAGEPRSRSLVWAWLLAVPAAGYVLLEQGALFGSGASGSCGGFHGEPEASLLVGGAFVLSGRALVFRGGLGLSLGRRMVRSVRLPLASHCATSFEISGTGQSRPRGGLP